jgi:hypothetical protein
LAYKKTVIRQYFTALLAGVTSVSERVYSGRIDPKEDENYPYLTVFTKDETIEEQFTSHTNRDLELHVGIIAKDNSIGSADFYEVVESIMYDVESIMSKVITVQAKEIGDNFALFNDIVMTGSTTDHNNSSSSDIGTAIITYRINYDYELPILPLTLEDFDWQGSIDNLIITNPGVPENV